MARKPKSPAEIRAQMDALRNELKEAEAREAERLGGLAVKAGLHEIDVSDSDLVQALKEVVTRFQSKAE